MPSRIRRVPAFHFGAPPAHGGLSRYAHYMRAAWSAHARRWHWRCAAAPQGALRAFLICNFLKTNFAKETYELAQCSATVIRSLNENISAGEITVSSIGMDLPKRSFIFVLTIGSDKSNSQSFWSCPICNPKARS